MTGVKNMAGTRPAGGVYLTISILLLLLHCYYYRYDEFDRWGFTNHLSDTILDKIVHTPLIRVIEWGKSLALLFLGLSLLAADGKKVAGVSYRRIGVLLGMGLVIYFGDGLLPAWGEGNAIALLYLGMIGVGYLMIAMGGSKLAGAIRGRLTAEYFRDDKGGFKQEEEKIETPYSLHFKAVYSFNGEWRNSYINIINPRRGVLLIGSPGAGKSWFVIEPVIEQLIAKGMALFVYDFKYPVLTKHAYNHFLLHKNKYLFSTRFYSINFTDLSRSHRCNLIDPETLDYVSDAMGVSKTLMTSINKTWAAREGDFFVDSPIIFLGALIWYLKNYKEGRYCTLPHVIELSNTPYEELFTLLNVEPATRGLVDMFVESYRNKTMEMLDGQIASAKAALSRIISTDFYYVLSGNDLQLDINNPAKPAILCLGSDPRRQEALGPIMSLYIDRLNKRINTQGRHPSALVLDEFAMVRATSVLTTVATGRANDIIPIISVQDINQLRSHYTRDEAEQFMTISGNIICGQVSGDTAQWVSERFQRTVQYKTTVSVNSHDTSISKSEQSVEAVSAATIAALSSGEFVGMVADDPEKRITLKGFHARIVKEEVGRQGWVDLPVVREVDSVLLQENFSRIQKEVATLVREEMKRIVGDPGLKGWVVKR
jgi:YWFCY protein/TraM recognition site of TraD and TraG